MTAGCSSALRVNKVHGFMNKFTIMGFFNHEIVILFYIFYSVTKSLVALNRRELSSWI